MFLNIFHKFLSLLSQSIGKKVFYTSFESLTFHDQMAVLDPLWFWYVGNIYDTSDIAYGIANRSSVVYEWEFVAGILRKIHVMKDSNPITFYDIWANTGYFGVLSKKLWANTIVHFFEPLSVHTDCIKKSLYLNRWEEESTIHQIGLWNENTEKTFYIAWSGSSLISSFSGTSAKDTCTISVKKLTDYQKQEQLEFPDFVKIDVEGNEYDVIAWGISVFSQSKPVLYVEIAKDLKNIGRDFTNPNFDVIFTLLSDIWYIPYRVSDDYKKVTRFTPQPEESGVHMYLFLHPDTHTSIIADYAN